MGGNLLSYGWEPVSCIDCVGSGMYCVGVLGWVFFGGGVFCFFLKKVYKDGERIGKGTVLKRVNGIPGLSHEKQGTTPKLGED